MYLRNIMGLWVLMESMRTWDAAGNQQDLPDLLDTLLAEIHEGLSLREAAWFGYEQNEGREQQSDYDRAMFHEKLLADGETAEELARRSDEFGQAREQLPAAKQARVAAAQLWQRLEQAVQRVRSA